MTPGRLLFVRATAGAPEVLKTRFARIPDNYDTVYRHHACRGGRVLAVGYKTTTGADTPQSGDHAHALAMDRDAAECDLTFGGFLVVRGRGAGLCLHPHIHTVQTWHMRHSRTHGWHTRG